MEVESSPADHVGSMAQNPDSFQDGPRPVFTKDQEALLSSLLVPVQAITKLADDDEEDAEDDAEDDVEEPGDAKEDDSCGFTRVMGEIVNGQSKTSTVTLKKARLSAGTSPGDLETVKLPLYQRKDDQKSKNDGIELEQVNPLDQPKDKTKDKTSNARRSKSQNAQVNKAPETVNPSFDQPKNKKSKARKQSVQLKTPPEESLYVYVGFDDRQSYFVSLKELKSRAADLHPEVQQRKNEIDQEHIVRYAIFKDDWKPAPYLWKVFDQTGSVVDVPSEWKVPESPTITPIQSGLYKIPKTEPRRSTRGQTAKIDDFPRYIKQLDRYWDLLKASALGRGNHYVRGRFLNPDPSPDFPKQVYFTLSKNLELYHADLEKLITSHGKSRNAKYKPDLISAGFHTAGTEDTMKNGDVELKAYGSHPRVWYRTWFAKETQLPLVSRDLPDIVQVIEADTLLNHRVIEEISDKENTGTAPVQVEEEKDDSGPTKGKTKLPAPSKSSDRMEISSLSGITPRRLWGKHGPRKISQKAVMDNVSATRIAEIFWTGKITNFKNVAEWLHRSAYSFAGFHGKAGRSQSKKNLIFGTYEANTLMIRYEEAIKRVTRALDKKRTEFILDSSEGGERGEETSMIKTPGDDRVIGRLDTIPDGAPRDELFEQLKKLRNEKDIPTLHAAARRLFPKDDKVTAQRILSADFIPDHYRFNWYSLMLAYRFHLEWKGAQGSVVVKFGTEFYTLGRTVPLLLEIEIDEILDGYFYGQGVFNPPQDRPVSRKISG